MWLSSIFRIQFPNLQILAIAALNWPPGRTVARTCARTVARTAKFYRGHSANAANRTKLAVQMLHNLGEPCNRRWLQFFWRMYEQLTRCAMRCSPESGAFERQNVSIRSNLRPSIWSSRVQYVIKWRVTWSGQSSLLPFRDFIVWFFSVYQM